MWRNITISYSSGACLGMAVLSPIDLGEKRQFRREEILEKNWRLSWVEPKLWFLCIRGRTQSPSATSYYCCCRSLGFACLSAKTESTARHQPHACISRLQSVRSADLVPYLCNQTCLLYRIHNFGRALLPIQCTQSERGKLVRTSTYIGAITCMLHACVYYVINLKLQV